MYPASPAYVDLHQRFTLMCKTNSTLHWINTLIFDDANSNVLYFEKALDGSCVITISNEAHLYVAVCDFTTGEFNVTLLSLERNYHNTLIRCSVKFNNGPSTLMENTSTVISIKDPPDDSPTITQIPEGDIDTGDAVLLNCSLKGGNPVAILSWNCSGNIHLTRVGNAVICTLEFNVNKLHHETVCTCLASHNTIDSYSDSTSHSLHVLYPPDHDPTIQQDIPGPVDSGSSVSLIYSVSGGNPLASLSWDCKGITHNSSSSTKTEYIVTFTVNKTFDGRVCTCSASHPIVSYRRLALHQLIVFYEPGKPKLLLGEEFPWFVGNKTTVNCSAIVGNPESIYKWVIGGHIQNENRSYINIGPLSKEINGQEISCSVNNNYSLRKKIILQPAILKLNVECEYHYYYNPAICEFQNVCNNDIKMLHFSGIVPSDDYPEIEFDIFPVYVVEGENISITCNTRGNPLPNTQWFINGIERTQKQQNKSVLYLFNVNRLFQARTYSCKAISKSFKYDILIQNKDVNVIVFYNTSVTKVEVLNGPTFSENRTAVLRCQVTGNPLPNVTWYFKSNETKQILQRQNRIIDSNYTINTTNCLHTGIYECSTQNTVNGTKVTNSKQTELKVTCSPRLDNRYNELPAIMTFDIGSGFNLTVFIVAYPPPQIRWLLFSNALTSSYSKRGGSAYASTLNIYNATSSDFGRYTVHSYNSMGDIFIHLSVLKKGKPTAPVNINIICNEKSVHILWVSRFNGGSKQTFFVEYWESQMARNRIKSAPVIDFGESETINYVANGLLPATNYSFQILASNVHGISISDTVECMTDLELTIILTFREQVSTVLSNLDTVLSIKMYPSS
ncbi:HMCN [Mytilus coruscus]|uniref:HMCN n=1 Tax=Mytilus coruscus TaxID=42192 RepID=A0A6J8B5P9_MYTCO|nr:HMCN [Mytilus coruscus]